MNAVRVLLADDQELVRAGLRAILTSADGVEVVAEAGDGAEAVARTGEVDPDVVVMDVQMPGVDGLAATRELVRAGARAAVLVLTTFDRDDYLFGALEAGASGFLLKNAPPERLIEAVRVLAAGDALLAPDVTRRVIGRFRPQAAPMDPAALEVLTDREREVLDLVARGRSNAEVGAALYLGEATVKTHVSHMLTKLGLRDRLGLVVWAFDHGLARPGG